MSFLDLRNIEVGYSGGFVLSVDQLALEPGGIYMLAGPNGSGKSTLLNTLALLQRPLQGTLSMLGEKIIWTRSQLQRLRRRATLVHQSPYLFNATVRTNLAMALSIHGIHGSEQTRRIESSLSAVDMSAFLQRPAKKLSGGESRRVALARALSLNPEILLLDEPTANLDSHSIRIFEEVIRTLPALGITVIMSSHDPAQPQRLGGKLLHLNAGRMTNVSEM